MDPTMDFTWKGIFYAAEAYLLILLGADFLSDGILPVNRAVGTWQRIKKALVGLVLAVGSFYFFYQLANREDSFEFVPWIYALTVLLLIQAWLERKDELQHTWLSCAIHAVVSIVLLTGCFVTYTILYCKHIGP